jgi:ABC-type oligopeptide transport system substrate-binding subunit
VDVQPTYAASSTFAMLLRRGEFDVVLVHLSSPDGSFYWPYSCRNIGDLNRSGYCSRQTERDLDQAGLIVDERLWARVVNAADAKLARDVPVIPLFTLPYTVAHRSPIRNIVPNRSKPYWNAGSWWLAP